MEKPAPTSRQLHELLKRRWSPRAFSDKPVPPVALANILEAARWSPSASNRQPWSFIVGTKGEGPGHETILGCLNPGNRVWASKAPVLIVAVASPVNDEGKPNGWAQYDTGQAVAHLSIQAMAEGMWVHQMGGFDKDGARKALGIPEGREPVTVIALGHAGEPSELPADLEERERAPRQRKELGSFVNRDRWGGMMEFIG